MIRRFIKFLTENKILFAILLVAACLRFVGTNPGYNKFLSDEGMSYSAAVSMIKNGNLDPLRYDYPTVVPLVNYIFFKILFVPLGWGRYYLTHLVQIFDGLVHIPIAKLEAQRILQVFIFGEREVNALFWGRYVTALFSLGNVLAVYLLAKKLFNKDIALISALLLAVNFKAVVNSHIGWPDTYNAFFLLLSLIFSYRIIENSSVKNYLLAGVFLGLSISTKYQVFAVLPLLVSHIYASWFDRKKLFSSKIILAGLSAAAVFILLNPYFWLYFEKSLDILSYVSKKYAMGRMKLITYPFYYFYHIDYGLPLFVSVILGLFLSLKKFGRQTLLLLAEILPFFFVMVYFSVGGFYIRNFITITPLLMVLGAVFISSLLGRLKNKPLFKYLSLLIIIGVVFTPLKNSVINSYYYTKQWTYDEILNKSRKVLPEDSLVASHPFDPLPGNVKRADFVRATSYSLAEFREEGADYALINMDWASGDFYGWMPEVFPNSLKYFQKPVDEMRDTFSGLAIEEMMSFVVASSYKPWQAPDAALFLVKIPYFKDTKFVNPNNIQLSSGDFLSQEINIKSNFVYKVSGYLKSSESVKKEKRSVFLRIDFFDSSSFLGGNGAYSSVSPRYYRDGWQKVELLTLAPRNTSFARVSVQAYGGEPANYLVKNVMLEESVDSYILKDSYEKIDFGKYKDLLYPYSHGNL
ncbi:MAG: hypothetical protein COV26_00980 [Candidatus Nealsonbacteria bacterium CG10_big_fil_rev_8_21_14_0_10_36_23]|uniref:Glycosyltransferase RgtA/B/C/D-like domain-containing protein n=1 Tax=Candidatus Nealsonbacteria bacterium CG10_big_fil_rev_8_21_14_0_10_36_23 TaxID=1974709 RepID=A0A2H0TLE8_9BACT|nr:MAG: hypothetical protein COV26_00980 [Candidatus Nealsonbacteria bacterium CG10_big_fil_rev_8_21_14_0_10_36_23]